MIYFNFNHYKTEKYLWSRDILPYFYQLELFPQIDKWQWQSHLCEDDKELSSEEDNHPWTVTLDNKSR